MAPPSLLRFAGLLLLSAVLFSRTVSSQSNLTVPPALQPCLSSASSLTGLASATVFGADGQGTIELAYSFVSPTKTIPYTLRGYGLQRGTAIIYADCVQWSSETSNNFTPGVLTLGSPVSTFRVVYQPDTFNGSIIGALQVIIGVSLNPFNQTQTFGNRTQVTSANQSVTFVNGRASGYFMLASAAIVDITFTSAIGSGLNGTANVGPIYPYPGGNTTLVGTFNNVTISGGLAASNVYFFDIQLDDITFNGTVAVNVSNGLTGVPITSFVRADPHITTWDGVVHTVFTEGDFILMHSAMTGMAVHGRFCKNARGHWASWTCAVAVRCDSTSEPTEVSALGWTAELPEPHSLVSTLASDVIQVTCPSGLSLLLKRQRFHRHFHIDARITLPFIAPGDVAGLLGTPNGDRSDDLQGRHGANLAVASPTEHFVGHASEILDAIHASWTVPSSEQLFKSEFVPTGGLQAHSRHNLRWASSLTQAAESKCRAAGLVSPTDVAICVHDMLAVNHDAAPESIAAFVKLVAENPVVSRPLEFVQ